VYRKDWRDLTFSSRRGSNGRGEDVLSSIRKSEIKSRTSAGIRRRGGRLLVAGIGRRIKTFWTLWG